MKIRLILCASLLTSAMCNAVSLTANERVEKIHEFSLHVQNRAKANTHSKPKRLTEFISVSPKPPARC